MVGCAMRNLIGADRVTTVDRIGVSDVGRRLDDSRTSGAPWRSRVYSTSSRTGVVIASAADQRESALVCLASSVGRTEVVIYTHLLRPRAVAVAVAAAEDKPVMQKPQADSSVHGLLCCGCCK